MYHLLQRCTLTWVVKSLTVPTTTTNTSFKESCRARGVFFFACFIQYNLMPRSPTHAFTTAGSGSPPTPRPQPRSHAASRSTRTPCPAGAANRPPCPALPRCVLLRCRGPAAAAVFSTELAVLCYTEGARLRAAVPGGRDRERRRVVVRAQAPGPAASRGRGPAAPVRPRVVVGAGLVRLRVFGQVATAPLGGDVLVQLALVGLEVVVERRVGHRARPHGRSRARASPGGRRVRPGTL